MSDIKDERGLVPNRLQPNSGCDSVAKKVVEIVMAKHVVFMGLGLKMPRVEELISGVYYGCDDESDFSKALARIDKPVETGTTIAC